MRKNPWQQPQKSSLSIALPCWHLTLCHSIIHSFHTLPACTDMRMQWPCPPGKWWLCRLLSIQTHFNGFCWFFCWGLLPLNEILYQRKLSIQKFAWEIEPMPLSKQCWPQRWKRKWCHSSLCWFMTHAYILKILQSKYIILAPQQPTKHHQNPPPPSPPISFTTKTIVCTSPSTFSPLAVDTFHAIINATLLWVRGGSETKIRSWRCHVHDGYCYFYAGMKRGMWGLWEGCWVRFGESWSRWVHILSGD